MDIHNYKGRFGRTLVRLDADKEISVGNREIIHKFKDNCLCRNISYGKLDAYLFYLMKFTKMLDKPIGDASKEDIMKVMADLNQTDYSEETKVCFKIVIRKVYQMVRGFEGKEYPEEVKWITTTISQNHRKLPEELLTEEEVQNIIRAGQNTRDKALLSCLAESGCRISEIGTLQIKHVSFEEYGARLTVKGKTGTRKILIINSTPYLQEWINQHPDNENSDSYLWYNQQDNPCLSYARISAILKLASKRAKIKKRVYPHLLRHTRATRMANIMSEAAMKQYFGWTQSSKMAGIYVHMSGKDTDEAVLRANGIEVKQKDKPDQRLKPVECQRCKKKNESTNKFCKICGLPLDKKSIDNLMKEDTEKINADNLMEELVNDKEILAILVKKIMEKKLI